MNHYARLLVGWPAGRSVGRSVIINHRMLHFRAPAGALVRTNLNPRELSNTEAFQCDVTSEENIQELAAHLKKSYGKLGLGANPIV